MKHLSVEMEIWKHGPLALKSTFDAIQAVDQYVGYELLGGVTNRWKIKKVNNLKSTMYFPIVIYALITNI